MVLRKTSRPWSPVQSVLKLSNLPPGITPPQIRQMLSYVKNNWSTTGLQKVESGVTVIQIYPSEACIPKFSKPGHSSGPRSNEYLQVPDSPTPHLRDSSFSNSPNAIMSDPLHVRDQQSLHHVQPALSLPVTPAFSTSNSLTVTDQLNEATTPIVPAYHGVTHMQSSTPLPSEILENEETCIAYIHFSSVGYLFQAESTLRQVTVNGKRVKVRYKWWHTAPFFRVLEKLRSGAR